MSGLTAQALGLQRGGCECEGKVCLGKLFPPRSPMPTQTVSCRRWQDVPTSISWDPLTVFSFLGGRDCGIAVSTQGCSILSVVTTGKGLTLNCGERHLIIPHLCPAAGGEKVEMKLLTVSQLAPPCVCIHLCLISLSGTISPGS